MTDSNQSSGEREAIVAWLREQGLGFDSLNLVWMGDFLRQRAYQIERGDHLPSPPTQENNNG